MVLLLGVSWGQTLYWGGTSAQSWTSSTWNTSCVTFTSAWTSTRPAYFCVANSTITGTTTQCTGITADENVTVTPTGTLGTNGTVATITVANGKTFDFGTQAISIAAGTGFIKAGAGTLAIAGGTYTGGFTLNAGIVVLRGVNGMGAGGALTINGGTIAGSATRDLTDKYAGGITIGGDFTLGSSTSPAVGTSNLTFTNNMVLGGTTRTITIGGTGTYFLNGVISNGSLIVTSSAAGIISLGGVNTYIGGTTITGGTLQLGAAGGVLADAGTITLNGGTFKTGATTGFDETVGTLNLSDNSTIALETGVHTLTFANSSAISWTAGKTLTITGWTGTAGVSGTSGKIFVGVGGLTSSQLAQVTFSGYPGAPIILGTGEMVPPGAYSDIITFNGESATISSTINDASPLTTGTGVQVWQFKVRDGGAGLNDVDVLPTILNSFTISQAAGNAVSDWQTAIKTIELFDGVSNVAVGTVTTGPNQISFTGLNVSIADNTEKTLSLRLSLNCGIGSANFDGDDFGFQISNGNVTFSASGSGKAAFPSISTSNGQNVITVVATQLTFSQQPTSTGVSATMTPFVVVKATDACGNIDKDFTGNISISSTGTMTGTPIVIAATAGVATYSSIIHSVAGTNLILTASAGGFANVLSNNFDIYVVTVFQRGDFAVISVNSNISCLGAPYTAGDDQISFIIFKDINPGDVFTITDNGYERLIAGKWGNTEGTYQITRTTSTISAGTVITIRLLNNAPFFEGVYPDNNWTMSNIGWAGTSCVLNSGGDQIYFMQGGSWNKGTSGNHDATYTPGVVLYAFNTNNSWTSFGASTQESGLLLGMECFYMMPGVATDFIEYTGLTTPATKRDWLNRLNNVANWTGRVDCATYFANNIHYGQTYSVLAGGYNDGIWTGDKNTDWFNCGNWQNLDVPSLISNVSIPNSGVTNEPTIGEPPTTPVLYTSAECNNLTIESSRTLTINNANSILDIYGNITNSGAVNHTNGLVRLYGGNTNLTSTSLITFYNLQLNKTLSTSIFTLNNNISVSNSLTLTSGVVSTGANKLSITNTTAANLIHSTGSASFINGNLQRSITTNTNVYEFPLGNGVATTNYKRIDFVNNNIGGTTSLLGSVNAISEVGNNIDSRIVATQSGSTLTNVFENAEWNLIPDLAVTSGNYGVRLYVANTGLSATDDNTFCPLKRTDISTDYADWNSFETLPTTIPIANAAGRIYNSGNGYAERLEYTSFSKFAIARTPNYPLPIELTLFKGLYQNKGIKLLWQTASETNNNYFEILKSKDLNYFEKSGTVVGAGNSNNISKYEYFDNNPFNGNNYYKLKQVDFDGRSSESNVIVVQIKNSDNINIYYNNNSLFVTTNNTDAIDFVEISDITGKIIYLAKNNFDENNVQINIGNLAKGVYFAKVLCNSQVEVRKFIVQ